ALRARGREAARMTGEATAAVAPPSERPRDGPARLSGPLTIALGAAALAATGAAVFVTATSNHAPGPAGHAVLSVVLCLSFAGAALGARRRPPYGRFGLLLAAVGFSSLLGSLHDANDALPYTIGVVSANLVFALLIHALLAFPDGRLGSRTSRLLALAAYLNVLWLQALAVLFDPLTRWHSAHPRNLALVSAHETLSTVLEQLEAALAGGIPV